MAIKSDQDTYVVRKGVSPNTVSEISSKTKIYAVPAGADQETKIQVGVISGFNPSESRSIEPIRGIGFGDQIAELIPGVTDAMSLSIDRTAQYLSNMYQAFGYNGGIDGLVRSLKHHRWPFDITKETVFSELVTDLAADKDGTQSSTDDNFSALRTIFEACWFSDWNTSYSSDTALVQESCSVMVSDVYDGTNIEIGGTPEIDTGNRMISERMKMMEAV